MSTEKKLNDAIAIVQDAAREGRLQVNLAGVWEKSNFHMVELRAKPEPVEAWCLIHDKDKILYWRDQDAISEQTRFGGRIVHLREVEE